jgi:hypothetical protein
MKISGEFGKIVVDGNEYSKDIIIKKGKIEKRKKKASKEFKEEGGHTPLTDKENIPWKCKTLLIGTGFDGALPIDEGVHKKASKKGVELKIMKTGELINYINGLENMKGINAIIHITC